MKNKIKGWVKRLLGTISSRFSPYEKKLDVKGAESRFFFATPQAQQWYDPLKPYAKLEYEWVVDNIPLRGERIIDGGSHHGQYSVVFHSASGGECELVSVDPIPMNCLLTEINLKLNGREARIVQAAISECSGRVRFIAESNGKISSEGGLDVEAKTLDQILPDATIVKLDIEGAEYLMLQKAVEAMPSVHTWIIEVHPIGNPHPDTILKGLIEAGFKLDYVDRELNQVVAYSEGLPWTIHSTVFARRKR